MTRAKFYHAGCSVCVTAEEAVVKALDPARFEVELVHLGEHPDRIPEAEREGVKTLPALVLRGTPFHINFGANLADLKG
jgi:hypothetical protein